MFTVQQILDAHAKTKTGADYPHYVQELKTLGIVKYDFEIESGKNIFFAQDGNSVVNVSTNSIYRIVSDDASPEQLRHIINIHQKGQTDFPTFCIQAAEAGVYKWTRSYKNGMCIL
jgi:uncharacterized protein YbcV (DUF1398 family)